MWRQSFKPAEAFKSTSAVTPPLRDSKPTCVIAGQHDQGLFMVQDPACRRRGSMGHISSVIFTLGSGREAWRRCGLVPNVPNVTGGSHVRASTWSTPSRTGREAGSSREEPERPTSREFQAQVRCDAAAAHQRRRAALRQGPLEGRRTAGAGPAQVRQGCSVARPSRSTGAAVMRGYFSFWKSQAIVYPRATLKNARAAARGVQTWPSLLGV
jgi:hypothetical protein